MFVRAQLGLGRSGQRDVGSAAAAIKRGIRPSVFYLTFAGLFGTNVLAVVAFLMAPDIAGLLNGQNEQVLTAYEDRIAELRVEIDRLHSRQYAQAGDINLQLQELSQQQELLVEQHQYVKALAEKASELGIEASDLPPSEGTAVLVTPSIVLPSSGDANAEIADAAATVQSMMDDSRLALVAISEEASGQTDEILKELRGIGIKPDMPKDAGDSVGGPFVPATDGQESTGLVDDANAVMAALIRFKAARSAIDLAPVHRPLDGYLRVSSGFGNRKDPFTGGKAYHAGLDFPAPSGTTVLSAGAGTVVYVGQRSGYGNLVEIDHGYGIITRYGHLSAFLVKEGQSVKTGTPIAKVGSTGRSTGPHLHFEVRRNDTAVDPNSFLNAGKRLEQYLATA